jgi:hypothetical protein
VIHHPLMRRYQASRLAEEPGVVEELATKVVDALVPPFKARVPELAEAFVDAAVPRVQERMVELEPQLRELAVSSANAVLSDPQIQETVKAAVQEQSKKTEAKVIKGMFLLGGAIIGANLLIEIAEPWLPGRKRR